jgi:hypothetical protein
MQIDRIERCCHGSREIPNRASTRWKHGVVQFAPDNAMWNHREIRRMDEGISAFGFEEPLRRAVAGHVARKSFDVDGEYFMQFERV